MSRKIKITLVLLGLSALSLHFILLLVHSFKSEPLHKKDYYAQAYIYPFFHQSWQLFVPPPNSNYRLLASFENNGQKQTDIYQEIIDAHASNRFRGYCPMLIAFTNAIHFFEHSTTFRNKLNGPVTNDLYFKILEHAAVNYLRATREGSISNIKLRLVIDDIGQGSPKIYFN